MFAGFRNKTNEEAEKLKQSSSARLQLVQLDVVSEAQVRAAAVFVRENLPAGTPGTLEA